MKIAKKMAEALELPREVVLRLPLICLTGRTELTVENYKGMLEYNEEEIRINTAEGILSVRGRGLCLQRMTAECVAIGGYIIAMEFLT